MTDFRRSRHLTEDGVTLYVHVTIYSAIHCKEQILTKANKELLIAVAFRYSANHFEDSKFRPAL